MIRVRVTLPPGFSRKKLDERGWMTLPEGATLRDVMKAVRMPVILAKPLMISINGAKASPDTVLKDGDLIAIVGIVSGG